MSMPAKADSHRKYVIGFYNLENLFDTYHDDGKNDYEYLPDGGNEWTEVKYQQKLQNMARHERRQQAVARRPWRI